MEHRTNQSFIDQLGRRVVLSTYPPRRIVSLVPSQTELLADLGLGAAVVGITKFCVHPQHWLKEKTRIGGTKTVHIDRVEELRPDLIIANKEENTQEQIEELSAQFPVWISDVTDLPSALGMIRGIGEITDKVGAAEEWAQGVATHFTDLTDLPTQRAAYFIWRNPLMAAASTTFIDKMMEKAGFENVFGQLQRYPEISAEQLREAAPAVILLSSEPYPFKAKHLAEFQELCPQAVIRLVDGELFSWYGSRLIHAPAYFRSLREALRI